MTTLVAFAVDMHGTALAADLIHNKVDVIAAMSGDVSIRAATTASSTIPVVFITGSDPVQTGLVANLARPGGNVTGFSMIANELMAKRCEMLSELVPQIRTIALLINPKYHSATEGTINSCNKRQMLREYDFTS